MFKKIRIYDCIFFVSVFAISCIMLWKVRVGMANIDETFHLTIPYRMTQGDCLLVDEWHVSQLWSVLLYPVMCIYRMCVPDTEGIVLNFRYIFVVFQLLVTAGSYILLRKRYGLLAVIIPVLYVMFVPFNIMALNYNSLGYAVTYMLVVLNLDETDKSGRFILNGILISALVLCNPYTICIYFLYLIYLFLNHRKKELLYTHIGIGCMAAVFLGLVLSQVTLRDILLNLPYIVSDAAHEPKSFWNFLEPFVGFVKDYYWYIGMFGITWLMAVCDKKRRKWWILWLGLFSLMVVWFFSLRSAMRGGIGINVIMFPLTPLGFVLFTFLKRKDWRFFCVGLLFPVLYALCMNMSSNLGMFVIADGCAVSSIMSLLLIRQWLEENDIPYRQLMVIFLFVVLAQLGAQMNVKVRHAFWEDNVRDLKYEIEIGPMCGLKTAEAKKIQHEAMVRDILDTGVDSEDYVLFYQYLSWGYLVTDARFGTFSAWTEAENALYSEKFMKYYEWNPDKIPDMIYVDYDGYETWSTAQWEDYCHENGYIMKKVSYGSYVLEKN